MTVAVLKTEKTDANEVGRLLELIGGIQKFVSRGDRVIIKPNICAARSSSTGTVTDPELCAAICRLVADCGGKPTVADSPIYPFPQNVVYRKAGYADFKSKYGFDFVDLDSAGEVRIQVPQGKVLPNVMVSRPLLERDVLINVPVMKTHVQTVATLGLKNLKGIVPVRHKHLIHIQGLDEGIVDLNTVFKSDLTIVDAIYGQDGPLSPTNGRVRHVGALLAGDNVVETDAACLQVMGVPLKAVRHIQMAEARGLGRTSGFELKGDPLSWVQTKFNYPKAPGLFIGFFRVFAVGAFGTMVAPINLLMGKKQVKKLVKPGEWIWDKEKCNGCRTCIKACPTEVLSYVNNEVVRKKSGCIYCFCCVEACSEGAIAKQM